MREGKIDLDNKLKRIVRQEAGDEGEKAEKRLKHITINQAASRCQVASRQAGRQGRWPIRWPAGRQAGRQAWQVANQVARYPGRQGRQAGQAGRPAGRQAGTHARTHVSLLVLPPTLLSAFYAYLFSVILLRFTIL